MAIVWIKVSKPQSEGNVRRRARAVLAARGDAARYPQEASILWYVVRAQQRAAIEYALMCQLPERVADQVFRRC